MTNNQFSLYGMVAAVDSRNIRAHLTGIIDYCTLCTTASGPATICPARSVAEAMSAASRPLTVTEIADLLRPAGLIGAW